MCYVLGSLKAKYSREWKLGGGGEFREKRVTRRNYLISATRGPEAAWVVAMANGSRLCEKARSNAYHVMWIQLLNLCALVSPSVKWGC